jgi:hypothetical protein
MEFRFLATDNKARHNGVVATITGQCSLDWRAVRIAETPRAGVAGLTCILQVPHLESQSGWIIILLKYA